MLRSTWFSCLLARLGIRTNRRVIIIKKDQRWPVGKSMTQDAVAGECAADGCSTMKSTSSRQSQGGATKARRTTKRNSNN